MSWWNNLISSKQKMKSSMLNVLIPSSKQIRYKVQYLDVVPSGKRQNADPKSADYLRGPGPWTTIVDHSRGPLSWTTRNFPRAMNVGQEHYGLDFIYRFFYTYTPRNAFSVPCNSYLTIELLKHDGRNSWNPP